MKILKRNLQHLTMSRYLHIPPTVYNNKKRLGNQQSSLCKHSIILVNSYSVAIDQNLNEKEVVLFDVGVEAKSNFIHIAPIHNQSYLIS